MGRRKGRDSLSRIAYSGGYKYQLRETYSIATGIQPAARIDTTFILLDVDGTLTIRAGYAWDGPSGPTFDTPSFMRGSVVHDALYQLMAENMIDARSCRQLADEILRDICIDDGMWRIRALWVYAAVRAFGYLFSASRRKVIYAPLPAPAPATN